MPLCGVSWLPLAIPPHSAPLVPAALLLPRLPQGLWPLPRQQPFLISLPGTPHAFLWLASGLSQLTATATIARAAEFRLWLLPMTTPGPFAFPFSPQSCPLPTADGPHQPGKCWSILLLNGASPQPAGINHPLPGKVPLPQLGAGRQVEGDDPQQSGRGMVGWEMWCCVCRRHSQDSQTLPGPTATEGIIPIL